MMKYLLAKIVRGPLLEFVIVGSVIVDFIKIFRKNAMPKVQRAFWWNNSGIFIIGILV